MSATAEELLQKLKATIGQETVFAAPEELGRAAFRKYALAIRDPNPCYTNQSFARRIGLGDVMAPPTLVCDSFQFYGTEIDDTGSPMALRQESVGIPLRAGNDYEFFQPVGPDDIITARRKVENVWRKEGRSGSLIFQEIDISYYNQHGQLLARNNELLFYRPPEEKGGP